MSIAILCPLSVVYNTSKRGKRSVMRLNLNIYRNTHYTILSKAKKAYKRELLRINPHIVNSKVCKPVDLVFRLYKPSKRKIDRANVCCVVEKFACDVIVECGVMPDDNDEFIKSTTYITGGVDRQNPRVEMFILE